MAGATLSPGEDLNRMSNLAGAQPPSEPGGQGPAGPDPRGAMMRQIGITLTAATQRRFREQRFGTLPWEARKIPNIAGIIRDLESGKQPPKRRWEERPALSDTGRLRGSITYRIVNQDLLEVGSNLSYAGDAQWGADHVFPITPRVRSGIQKLVDAGKDVAGRLAALLDPDVTEYRVTTPERIFVGLDGADETAIGEIVERWFGGRPYSVTITP